MIEPIPVPDDPPVIEHQRTRQRRGRQPARIGVNLTAMIDVTFLLLVYFLLATQFKIGEEVYRLDLPDRTGRLADPFDLPREPIRVLVRSTGPAENAYQVRLEGARQQPATFESLHDLLRSNQFNDANPAGLWEADTPVLIVPSPQTRWEHAMEAFNAAARARYVNITFSPAGGGA